MVVPIPRTTGQTTRPPTESPTAFSLLRSFFLLLPTLFTSFFGFGQARTRLETPPPTFTVGGFQSDYGSIQAAVSAAPEEGAIIRIRPGVYRERVRITRSNIQLRGEGHDESKVVLIFAAPDPTLIVNANNFYAEGITVANDSAAQSPALAITGDQEVLRQVKLLGSVILNGGRTYFENCFLQDSTLSGTAKVLFSQCELNNVAGTSAFLFDRCRFTGITPSVRDSKPADAKSLDGWNPEKVH